MARTRAQQACAELLQGHATMSQEELTHQVDIIFKGADGPWSARLVILAGNKDGWLESFVRSNPKPAEKLLDCAQRCSESNRPAWMDAAIAKHKAAKT